MPATSLIGQPRVLDAIAHALESGRLAQSYLLYGPHGVGKRAAALTFAQGLLCENRASLHEGGIACGKCLACTKVVRGLHPDVHVYFPHPKDVDVDDVTARLQLVFEDPYALLDYHRRPSMEDSGKTSSKLVIYQAERVREIMHDLHYVPVEGAYSIGVILDADKMPAASANPFLKMLEEPPEKTVLILTAERRDQMLPTVLSRCQLLRLDPLPANLISEALIERKKVNTDRASYLARMADGSYSRALELLENESLAEQRELALEFIRASFTLNPKKLTKALDDASSLGRESVKQLFSLMLAWVRDLILYESTRDRTKLVNVDQAKAVEDFVEALPDARLPDMVDLIDQASSLLERNVHTGLTLTVLAHALNDAMRGKHRTNLYAPLDSPEEALEEAPA